MSRYKTNELEITFGNVVVLAQDGVLADTTTEMSMEFETEVSPTVGGEPNITWKGNTTWRLPLAVVEDFASRDDAFWRQMVIADTLEMDLKQGTDLYLTVKDGSRECTWVAGVNSASFAITLTGREGLPFRLTAQYEFVLGRKVSMVNM